MANIAARQETSATGDSAGPPLRILVIDDDAEDRMLFGQHLAAIRAHVNADYTSNPADARTHLARAEYDVMVIDHRLGGGITGFDLLLDLRRQGVGTPAILLTGVGGEEFAADVMKVHATDYLSKARLNADTLGRAIRYCRAMADRDRAARHAELQLRRSEERFRALVENSSDGLAIVDRDGIVQYAARSIERMLGYTADEFVGSSIFSHIHPDDAAWVTPRLEEMIRTPRRTIDVVMRVGHKNGTWRDIEATAENRLRDGAVDGIVANFRDVTAAREADQALKESERQFKAVFDTALDAMLITNDEGVYVDANAAACELHGVAREHLVGASPEDFLPPDVPRDQWREMFDALRHSGAAVGEMRIRRLDATERHVEFAARANVVPGRHVWFLRDVTERKRLEHQLLQSQKMETVGRLAGGIAHDFNNLLTAILGYCNLLLEQTSDDLVSRDVHEIRQAGERAASLTRQLLAFSRKQVLKPQVVDLNVIVRAMHGMLGRVLGEDVELTLLLSEGAGLVKVDPVQVEQVVLNLAVNARDAMPDGGVLTIETRRVDVDREFAASHPTMIVGPHVMLAVADSGVGMTDEVRAHIFEPFFTTKGQGKGTGLGLAMVYGIVKQSGGSIWVSSEPNQGATFQIYLPITDERASPPFRREARPSGGHETVLLVEDEPTVRGLARRVLESQGYIVLAASNGRDACALADRHDGPIDLLVTDVVMPGMSGREIVSYVQPRRPAMKVLYMSGYTDNTIERHGILAPGVTFFHKPFTPSGLANVVRQTLDGPVK
jgi:PAS domain S-box-containing protein